MKLRHFAAGAAFLGLAGCGSATPSQQAQIEQCIAALAATGFASPAALLGAAATTPACMGLAQSLIQQIVGQVAPANLARDKGLAPPAAY